MFLLILRFSGWLAVQGCFGLNGLAVKNPTILIHSIADFCSIEHDFLLRFVQKLPSIYLAAENCSTTNASSQNERSGVGLYFAMLV